GTSPSPRSESPSAPQPASASSATTAPATARRTLLLRFPATMFSSRRVFRVRRTEHRRAYPSTTRWGGRVDGTVPHSAAPPCVAAPGSAPTSPPGPDTPTHSPRSHPLPVDIGGTERRV